MKTIDATLEIFLGALIDKLAEQNNLMADFNVDKIDIPFVVAPLYQSFSNLESLYTGFILDLKNYPDYEIQVNPDFDHMENLVVKIFPVKKLKCIDDEFRTNYSYQFKFFKKEEYLGYCRCTPKMDDYREDKNCCGHTCDSVRSTFEMEKVYRLVSGEWNGDQSDYWKFEDEFYLQNEGIKR